MTLLEVIAKAADNAVAGPSKHPIVFNTDPILPNLKRESENPADRSYLIEPLTGFKISDTDSAVSDLNSEFHKKLEKKLNGRRPLTSSGFVDMLVDFLEQISSQVGVMSEGEGRLSKEVYAQKLIEPVGNFLSVDVIKLVCDGCVLLGVWGLLETLIVNNLVAHGIQSGLLSSLIEKNRSDLVCLCVKSFSNLNWLDFHGVLRYFLSPSREARVNMAGVRKEWEGEALLAVKKAWDTKLAEKKLGLAKDAAVLLMVAYDGFTSSELCLHYLMSVSVVDDVMFSSAVSKLNVEEILGLIRYLGKWLRKYERFPQANMCSEAQTMLGLSACQWVPSLEAVAKILGLVIDEHFSALVLHSDFHEELESVGLVLGSLVVEGKLCSSVTSLIDIYKPEA